MPSLYPYDFSVAVKDPLDTLRLANRFSRCGRVDGYDSTGKKKVSVILRRSLVILHEAGSGAVRRIGFRDFFGHHHRFDLAYMLTLKWKSPGGWSGSPLEMLALAAGDLD